MALQSMWECQQGGENLRACWVQRLGGHGVQGIAGSMCRRGWARQETSWSLYVQRFMAKPFTEPSTVTHEDGEIVIRGPDGVEFSLTPTAALVTASRIESEAMDALLEHGTVVTNEPK